jgi:hypothetical protein
MQIMPTREDQLMQAFEGLVRTGIPFVGYHEGKFIQAPNLDDIGIYYFIPKLMTWLGLSMESAINLFFLGILLISFLAGIIGVFLYYKKLSQRVISIIVMIIVTLYSIRIGDLYIVLSSLIMAFTFLLLYAVKDRIPKWRIILIIFPAVAFFTSIAHFIRGYSGLGLIFFSLVLLFLYLKGSPLHKFGILLLMLAAALPPYLFFNELIRVRNIYLHDHHPEYHIKQPSHPIWHTMYIGLGYTKNPWVPKYLDEVGMDKVKSIDPNAVYLSDEYNDILRQEYFKFLKQYPQYFAKNILAKIIKILFYLVIWANVGLIFFFLIKKPWELDLAFVGGMACNSLYGILAVPYPTYLLGFMTFAAFYGAFNINNWLETLETEKWFPNKPAASSD